MSIELAGTYKKNAARRRLNGPHSAIASSVFTDSVVSTSTVACTLRARSGLEEHEIREHREFADADRRVLFRPGIDDDLVLPFVSRLQDSDDAVVLELLADRPHEDRAHLTSEAGSPAPRRRRDGVPCKTNSII